MRLENEPPPWAPLELLWLLVNGGERAFATSVELQRKLRAFPNANQIKALEAFFAAVDDQDAIRRSVQGLLKAITHSDILTKTSSGHRKIIIDPSRQITLQLLPWMMAAKGAVVRDAVEEKLGKDHLLSLSLAVRIVKTVQ